MAIPTPEPRIARFERMGYGMFIHWGLYAHLGPVSYTHLTLPTTPYV